ncbi:uncharacterized protein JCM6883_005927 [Sporobolomyces salmoneus]|uniref:uncharacterized protein n=1 Tax=Sporobolomyces salmoneus TaxID=183962 RepID=UPI0031815C1E
MNGYWAARFLLQELELVYLSVESGYQNLSSPKSIHDALEKEPLRFTWQHNLHNAVASVASVPTTYPVLAQAVDAWKGHMNGVFGLNPADNGDNVGLRPAIKSGEDVTRLLRWIESFRGSVANSEYWDQWNTDLRQSGKALPESLARYHPATLLKRLEQLQQHALSHRGQLTLRQRRIYRLAI